MDTSKTEVWFYHLERSNLERVLPDLLEKTRAKGWRAIVRVGTPERLEHLNTHLWTYQSDSFLPHGAATDGHEASQPIFLTCDETNPNEAQALFLVDGAAPGDVSSFERCISIFDGNDEEALATARTFWKDAKAKDFAVTYWQQSPQGRWEKKG